MNTQKTFLPTIAAIATAHGTGGIAVILLKTIKQGGGAEEGTASALKNITLS